VKLLNLTLIKSSTSSKKALFNILLLNTKFPRMWYRQFEMNEWMDEWINEWVSVNVKRERKIVCVWLTVWIYFRFGVCMYVCVCDSDCALISCMRVMLNQYSFFAHEINAKSLLHTHAHAHKVLGKSKLNTQSYTWFIQNCLHYFLINSEFLTLFLN